MNVSLLESARTIYESALEAVKPERLVRARVARDGVRLVVAGRGIPIGESEGVDLLAIGKAAPAMAGALADILGDKLRDGLVIGLPGAESHHRRFRFLPGSHPLPDERSTNAGFAALSLAAKTDGRDLLILALSGGGSAMACVPAPGIALEDKIRVTAALLARGASIDEMNTVRKHLSAIKGGRLARAAFPARVVNLLLSDVAGDDPGTIASGPGYPDATTFSQSAEILSRYGIGPAEFPSVLARIEEGAAGLLRGAVNMLHNPYCSPSTSRATKTSGVNYIPPGLVILETPKPGDRIFAGVETFIIGRNADALEAARRSAVGLGFEAVVRTDPETGEARDAARAAMVSLAAMAASRPRDGRPLCLISGGEHTVRVQGKGRGGRNQEFILASLLDLAPRLDPEGPLGGRDWLVLSLGTDGIDGPTDAAGAWTGPETWRRVRSLGLDPRAFLEDNDSHSFFRAAGGLVVTGPTGTNVMDLRLTLLA